MIEERKEIDGVFYLITDNPHYTEELYKNLDPKMLVVIGQKGNRVAWVQMPKAMYKEASFDKVMVNLINGQFEDL